MPDDHETDVLIATLARVESKLDTIMELYEQFRPLLERYQQASRAGNVLQARRMLKIGDRQNGR